MTSIPVHWLRCGLGALAAAAFAATTAEAGPLVIDGTYQETTQITSSQPPTPGACNSVSQSFFLFSRVPVGRQLIVTQVSCYAHLLPAAQVSISRIFAMRPNDNVPERLQALTPNPPVDKDVLINNTTVQLFNARERPVVEIAPAQDADAAGHCTIAGRIVETIQ